MNDPHPSINVVAAIIRQDDKILIAQRFDDAHQGGKWEFPGGKVEKGESLEVALIREIKEELGISIRVVKLTDEITHTYPDRIINLHFYESEILEGVPSAIECADIKWVKVKDLNLFEFPPADLELIKNLSR